MPRVFVIGSGALARSVCFALSTALSGAVEITVLARSSLAASEILGIAEAKAGLHSHPVSFQSTVVDFDRAGEVERVLGAIGSGSGPEVIVHCASAQSPWELTHAPSGWTDLIAAAGFGVTLPLQASFVLPVAEVVGRLWPDCVLINGCYPDAVNPVLDALGLPVFSGIGNIATLAAGAKAALWHADGRAVRMLAHHVHLHAPARHADEARVWVNGTELDSVAALLAPIRSADRTQRYLVAGHTAAQLVARVLDAPPLLTNLPGPLGLPGGYPVRVTGRRIELDLPDGVDAAAAVEWNQRAAHRDGVVVDAGQIRFPPAAREQLWAYLPDFARGFPATDIGQVGAALLDVRRRLRRQPSRAG